MENYRVSSLATMDYPRKEYVGFLKKTQRKIAIVCGEFDPTLYNSNEFVEAIKKFLLIQGEELAIIFNGESETKEDALAKIKTLNHKFITMLGKLEQNQQDKVKFYWAPLRPERHYTITDKTNTIIEEDHSAGGPRDIYCFKENEKVSKKWAKKFEELKKYCVPISTKELLEDYYKKSTSDTLDELLSTVKEVKTELKKIED